MTPATEDTAEMPSAQAFAELFFAPSQKPVRVTFGAATHVGHVRKTNEDQYAIVRRTRMRDVLLSSLPESSFPPSVEAAFVLAVADGVGGGAFGEIASRLVLESVWELAGRATSWVMKFTDLDALQLRERVNAYVDRIEERLKELGREDPDLSGMATTCTCAHIMGRDVVVSNIGDSRAYLWRGGDCRLLTHDHTLGELLKSAGLPDEDYDRLQNVLVNASPPTRRSGRTRRSNTFNWKTETGCCSAPTDCPTCCRTKGLRMSWAASGNRSPPATNSSAPPWKPAVATISPSFWRPSIPERRSGQSSTHRREPLWLSSSSPTLWETHQRRAIAVHGAERMHSPIAVRQ